jgi:hypothetical protein
MNVELRESPATPHVGEVGIQRCGCPVAGSVAELSSAVRPDSRRLAASLHSLKVKCAHQPIHVVRDLRADVRATRRSGGC